MYQHKKYYLNILQSATDLVTGVIDMDGITTSYNSRERETIQNTENELDD